MNPNWVKQNVTVVIFAGVFVVAMAAVLWLQKNALSRKQQIEAELQALESQLAGIRAAKPSPTRENIESLRHYREQLERQFADLLNAVSHSRIQIPQLGPVDFSGFRAQRLAHLRRQADAARIKLTEGFAFGFSRYQGGALPCRNLPEAECRQMLALLTKQVLSIEKITGMLLASQIEELKQIRRAEVEPGTPGPDALEVGVSTDPAGLYQTLPFEFQFVCSTDALRSFLNRLSKSEWFFAVRTLQIESEVVAGQSGDSSAEAPASPAAGPRSRLIVTMRIDLVEFGGAEPKPGA